MNLKIKNKNNFKKVILIIILLLLIVLAIMILTKKDKPDNINNMQSMALGGYTNTIGGITYNIDNQVAETPNEPDLTAGMIPVKYKNGNWIITDEYDEEWYNYGNGTPAYMMLSDGTYQSEFVPDMTNKKLAEDNIGKTVDGKDVQGTIFVWIPKYAYNENNDMIYLKTKSCIAGEYTTSELFTCKGSGVNGEDLAISGIWIEKESVLGNAEADMNSENNKYGIISNTKAEYIKLDENFINSMKVTGINDTDKEKIVLKVVDETLTEPIQTILSNVDDEVTIKIERTENKIEKVIYENGDVLEGNEDNTEFYYKVPDAGVNKFIIIDEIGNQKIVEINLSAAWQYGKLVTNYECSISGIQWRVFYKNSQNIYLIADDYIPIGYIPGNRLGKALTQGNTAYNAYFTASALNDYTGSAWIEENTNGDIREQLSSYFGYYTSTNYNMKATAYMLDISSWSRFRGDFAQYAIGGPTIQMLIGSYMTTHDDPDRIYQTYAKSATGYTFRQYLNGSHFSNDYNSIGFVDTSYDIYTKSDTSKANGMWIASPSVSGTSNLLVTNTSRYNLC